MPGTGHAARTIQLSIWSTDPLSRAGMAAQIRAAGGLAVVDEAALPQDGVALVVSDHVDVEAVQAIRAVRRRGIQRVLAVVSRLDDQGLLAAVEAGASGLLRRAEATPHHLGRAIRAVEVGEGTMPPDLLGRLMDQVGALQRHVLSPRGLTFRGLTEREVSVLQLLADGCDTAEIGRKLFYSERTVKNIVHDVTTRLSLRNRTHAVAYAIRQGLI